MAYWVEVDAKRGAGLIGRLGGATGERVGLAAIEVLYREVEMHLLRYGPLGPGRCHEGGDLLKGQCRRGTVEQLDPLHVFWLEVAEWFDLEAGECGVELGECNRIRAIERGELEAWQVHRSTVQQRCLTFKRLCSLWACR